MVRPSWTQIDDTAALVGGDLERDIEPGPSTLASDLPGERRADFAFSLAGPQLQ